MSRVVNFDWLSRGVVLLPPAGRNGYTDVFPSHSVSEDPRVSNVASCSVVSRRTRLGLINVKYLRFVNNCW